MNISYMYVLTYISGWKRGSFRRNLFFKEDPQTYEDF